MVWALLFLDVIETPISEVHLGDLVFVEDIEGHYEKHRIIGFADQITLIIIFLIMLGFCIRKCRYAKFTNSIMELNNIYI